MIFFRSFLLSLLFTAIAPAATVTWTGAGASTNWFDTANWSGGLSPTAADTAVFSSGVKACVVTQSAQCAALQMNGSYAGSLSLTAQLQVFGTFTQSVAKFSGGSAALKVSGLALSGSANFMVPTA